MSMGGKWGNEEFLNDENRSVEPDPEEFPEHVLHNIMTDEPSDMDTVFKKKTDPVIQDILALFLHNNIYIGGGKSGEHSQILQLVARSINLSLDQADQILWDTIEDRKTMGHCHDIILGKE